jgi:SAM-dependent methyltransferase
MDRLRGEAVTRLLRHRRGQDNESDSLPEVFFDDIPMTNHERVHTGPPQSPPMTSKCPGCCRESAVRYRLPNIWHQPAGTQPYEIRWCEECDLGFLDPRPSAEDLSLFQETRERFRVTALEQSSPRDFVEKVRMHLAWRVGHGRAGQIDAKRIHSLLGDGPTSICVLGYGDLDLLVQLRDLGHQVFGIEPNERRRLDARAKGLELWPGSAEDLPIQATETAFDAIFLNRDLLTALEPRAALHNARRLLKSGGYLFAEVPNHGSYSARRLGPAWSLWEAGNYINYFTTKSLSRFIQDAGYEVKEVLYRRYITQFTAEQMRHEQEIWDRLYSSLDRKNQKLPRRKSSIDLWLDLLHTYFLPPAEKYEIVAIVSTEGSHEGRREISSA